MAISFSLQKTNYIAQCLGNTAYEDININVHRAVHLTTCLDFLLNLYTKLLNKDQPDVSHRKRFACIFIKPGNNTGAI